MTLLVEAANPSPAKPWPARVWRFPLTRIAIAFLCVGAPVALAGALSKLALPGAAWRELRMSFGVLVLLAAYAAYVRFVERRPVTELALRGAWKEVGAGLLMGGLLFASVMGVLAALGALHVAGRNPASAAASMLPALGLAAIGEEIMFRGVIFRILEAWLGSWIALALSALLFGFAHAGNPGASVLTSSAVAIEAGVLLGAAYMLTRRLWLVMALHFAWNYTQGGVFSIAVSGVASQGLLSTQLSGPDWLTGGAFGAEASVVAVACCVLLCGVLLAIVARQGRFVPAFWRRRTLA